MLLCVSSIILRLDVARCGEYRFSMANKRKAKRDRPVRMGDMRLAPADAAVVRSIAAATDRPVSRVLRTAVREYLARYQPPEAPTQPESPQAAARPLPALDPPL